MFCTDIVDTDSGQISGFTSVTALQWISAMMIYMMTWSMVSESKTRVDKGNRFIPNQGSFVFIVCMVHWFMENKKGRLIN